MRLHAALISLIAVALLVAVGVGAGCGSVEEEPVATEESVDRPPGMTVEEWVGWYDFLCVEAHRETEALQVRAEAAESPEEALDLLSEGAQVLREFVDTLRSLPPPREDAELIERLIELNETGLVVGQDLLAAVRAGDREEVLRLEAELEALTEEGTALERQIGADQCADLSERESEPTEQAVSPSPGETELSELALAPDDFPADFETLREGEVDPELTGSGSVATFQRALKGPEGQEVRVVVDLLDSELDALVRVTLLKLLYESPELIEEQMSVLGAFSLEEEPPVTDVETIDVRELGERAAGFRATLEDASLMSLTVRDRAELLLLTFQEARTLNTIIWISPGAIDTERVIELARVQADRLESVSETLPGEREPDVEEGPAPAEETQVVPDISDLSTVVVQEREVPDRFALSTDESGPVTLADELEGSSISEEEAAVIRDGWIAGYEVGFETADAEGLSDYRTGHCRVTLHSDEQAAGRHYEFSLDQIEEEWIGEEDMIGTALPVDIDLGDDSVAFAGIGSSYMFVTAEWFTLAWRYENTVSSCLYIAFAGGVDADVLVEFATVQQNRIAKALDRAERR